MKSVPFILLFWAAAGIGISTFVEDAHGTPFIQTYVYGTWWFKLLWTAVVVTSVVSAPANITPKLSASRPSSQFRRDIRRSAHHRLYRT